MGHNAEDSIRNLEQEDPLNRTKAATILCLSMVNPSFSEKKCIVRWNQAKRQQFNLNLPLSDLRVSLFQKNTTLVMVFNKLNPDEEWGPIEDLFELMPYDPDKKKEARLNKRAEYRVQK